MKKIFFVVLLLSLGLSLFSCRKLNNESTVLFQDSFEYATATPWNITVPVNGWSNTVAPDNWNIIAGGVSGNALQYFGSGVSQLANSFSGSDYQISVEFMPVNFITPGWPFCLAGRIQPANSCYLVCVNDNGSNVYLEIDTYGGSLVTLASVIVPGAHPLNAGTWYTLTMTLDGSTITGNISDGALVDTTVTTTDSTWASGTVGLLVWDGVPAYDIRFDNYMVTTVPTP